MRDRSILGVEFDLRDPRPQVLNDRLRRTSRVALELDDQPSTQPQEPESEPSGITPVHSDRSIGGCQRLNPGLLLERPVIQHVRGQKLQRSAHVLDGFRSDHAASLAPWDVD